MRDILGYEKNVGFNDDLFTSEHMTVHIGGRLGLVQQVQGRYGQTIKPVRESGSSRIRFLQAGSQGQVSIARHVGGTGFFDGLNLDDACATLFAVTLDMQGDGSACRAARVQRGRGVKLINAVVADLGFSWAAGEGQLEVSETIDMRFEGMVKA